MRQQVKSKDSRRNRRTLDKDATPLDIVHEPQHTIQPFAPRTKAQQHYVNSIKTNTISFGIGPAGSGKSYVAAAYACELLESRKIDRIFLTRPAVEAGEKLGFLPGSEQEKYLPYIVPFLEIFYERLGRGATEYFIKHQRIVPVPLGFLQGRTLRNCLCILDEAENCTPFQIKMFLTRIGENCKVVLDGDLEQVSPYVNNSGLADAVRRLRNVPSVGVTEFTIDDIVRSGIVKDILRAYALKF
jgi:phosphate starvation-inducible PhoH-like protein